MYMPVMERYNHVHLQIDEMWRLDLLSDPLVFHADRGYDSNDNCRVWRLSHQSTSVSRGKSHRLEATKIFDKDGYHQRGMIGVLGERNPSVINCIVASYRMTTPLVRQDPGYVLGNIRVQN